MTRAKKIYLLLGILIFACIATLIVVQVEDRKEQISNSDAVILEVPADSVQSLSWEYEDTALAFHKEDTWLYDADGAFPVNEEKINELLEQFQEFKVSFTIEGVEDYAQYGLDDPLCTIRFATGDQSYEVLLGNYSDMDLQRYVSIGDGNVYLAAEDPWSSFEVVLSDMIKHDEIPEFDTVGGIQFSGAESYSITYEENNSIDTYCADDVYFTQRDGKNMPLDTSRVDSYLENISSLGLTDYVTYNASEEDLQAYGLDTPELVITVNYTAENEAGEALSNTFVLNVSRALGERQDAEETDGASDEEFTAYARVGASQIVYQIAAEDYEALMEASYDSLRHLEVLSAAFEDIYQFDISLEGANYTITTEEQDDGKHYYYQENELEIADLQSAIEGLRADSFTGEQPTQKEEISLTVHLENEHHPEVQIKLYRYDGDHCLAMVDGEPVSLVGRSYVVDLIEAVNAIVLN